MQRANFTDGGFVLHKIQFDNSKASAWYDKAGELLDIEAFDKNGRTKRVSKELKTHCIMLGQVRSDNHD